MTDLLIKLISCLNKCCCSHHTCLLPPHSISPTDTVQILTGPGDESKAYCVILTLKVLVTTIDALGYFETG